MNFGLSVQAQDVGCDCTESNQTESENRRCKIEVEGRDLELKTGSEPLIHGPLMFSAAPPKLP